MKSQNDKTEGELSSRLADDVSGSAENEYEQRRGERSRATNRSMGESVGVEGSSTSAHTLATREDASGQAAEALAVSRDPSDPMVSLGKITPARMSSPDDVAAKEAERGVEKAQEELEREARRA